MTVDCFGRLEVVFPLGPDGLRHSPSECLECGGKVECLRAALGTDQGAAVERGGVTDPAGAGRLTRGLKRWARLKAARQKGAA